MFVMEMIIVGTTQIATQETYVSIRGEDTNQPTCLPTLMHTGDPC